MKVSALAVILLGALESAPMAAHAQTAAQYNQAAQAIQLCSSAMGAMVPECANLRGALTGGLAGGFSAPAAVNPYAAAGAGNTSAVAAGLFGMATQAFSAARAAPAPAPAPATTDYYTATALATQAATQAYHACVARVGPTNTVGVQGCIAQLQAASGGAPAVAAPYPGQAAVGFPGTAMGGYPAQGYQAQSAAAPAAAAAISAFSALIGR